MTVLSQEKYALGERVPRLLSPLAPTATSQNIHRSGTSVRIPIIRNPIPLLILVVPRAFDERVLTSSVNLIFDLFANASSLFNPTLCIFW